MFIPEWLVGFVACLLSIVAIALISSAVSSWRKKRQMEQFCKYAMQDKKEED